jgi:hypothetical protein
MIVVFLFLFEIQSDLNYEMYLNYDVFLNYEFIIQFYIVYPLLFEF